MTAVTLYVQFDGVPVSEVVAGWEANFDAHLLIAQGKSLDEVEQAAQAWMLGHFKHPTGELETAWEKTATPLEGVLTNTKEYGRRRNYGFSGMTDRLGRFYPLDPGIEWAEHAVEMAQPYVDAIFLSEITQALGG